MLLNNILYIIATHQKLFLWNNNIFQFAKQLFPFEVSVQMLYEQVKILDKGMDIWLICNFSLNKDLMCA